MWIPPPLLRMNVDVTMKPISPILICLVGISSIMITRAETYESYHYNVWKISVGTSPLEMEGAD